MKKTLVLQCIFAAILLSACSSDKETAKDAGKYPVTNPVVVDTTYSLDYVANINSVYYVELRARVKGFIEEIRTDEGKEVKKGQILFTISNQEYKEELLKAKAAMKILEADLKALQLETKNLKSLVEKNVISKTELEIAETKETALKAKIEEAEANISEAEINLARTEIKSPFDGVIDLIPNKVGSLIDEGTLLSSITNNKEVFAYFNVSEREYLDFFSKTSIADSEKVSLIMANNAEHTSKGIIETVNGKIDKNTGSLTLRAHFPNAEQLVKHGSTGKVRVYLPVKKALIIPQKSTFEVQDKLYVYVLDQNNIVRMRSIIPKLRMAHLFIIESGLSVTDRIIYEGIQNVKEGVAVTPEFRPLKQILSQLSHH